MLYCRFTEGANCLGFLSIPSITVEFLNIETDRITQTVQTQIRLQSDKGLYSFPFHLHLLDTLLYCKKRERERKKSKFHF